MQPLTDIFTVIWLKKGTAEFEGGEAAAAAEMWAAGTDPAGDGPAPKPVSAALTSFPSTHVQSWSLWSSSFFFLLKVQTKDGGLQGSQQGAEGIVP